MDGRDESIKAFTGDRTGVRRTMNELFVSQTIHLYIISLRVPTDSYVLVTIRSDDIFFIGAKEKSVEEGRMT
jgi:hypothetical protein